MHLTCIQNCALSVPVTNLERSSVETVLVRLPVLFCSGLLAALCTHVSHTMVVQQGALLCILMAQACQLAGMDLILAAVRACSLYHCEI